MVNVKRNSDSRLRYKLRCKNTVKLTDIEHWLNANCEASYACQIDDTEPPNGRPNCAPSDVLIRFERKSDQEKFKEMLVPARAKA